MNQREEQLGKFEIKGSINNEERESFLQDWYSNKEQADLQRDFELKMLQAEQKKQEELWEGKIIRPSGFNVLIKPTDENPYLRKVSTSGIITNSSGVFQNPDSGETDMLERGIMYAKVLEVGPDVKHTVKGDEIIYAAQRMIPIPFKGEGYCLLNEGQILSYIGKENDLTQRFDK